MPFSIKRLPQEIVKTVIYYPSLSLECDVSLEAFHQNNQEVLTTMAIGMWPFTVGCGHHAARRDDDRY